jgi:hypothetical protein
MESPERPPAELSAEQASEDLDPDRGPLESEDAPEEVPVRSDLDEELEDRGDV